MKKLNEIKFDCPKCDGKKADVQAKIVITDKTSIQVKCLKCKTNYFLPEDDKRCTKFFK